jgi:serine/threonine protein kinase
MALVCQQCGQPNVDGAEFCANPACGAFLGWGSAAGNGGLAGGDQRGREPAPIGVAAEEQRGSEPAPIDLGVEGISQAVKVGQGGFGTVYRATQPAFGRTVAVKVLNVPMLDAESRRDFDRECRALGSLSNHPYVVTLFAGGVSKYDRPYLVMDYLPGGSLASKLHDEGPMPWAASIAIGIKLASALASAHAAGVLHRDIKPENVLVSAYGEPQLADFGVARLEGGTRTASGTITGSIAHASPEVLSGVSATEASDVWSLASTVATLIIGEAPFHRSGESSLHATITRILTAPPRDLRPLGVPEAVCTALEAAMAKDSWERTPDAVAFGRALQAAQQSLGLPETAMPLIGGAAIRTPPAQGPAPDGPAAHGDSARGGAPPIETSPAPPRDASVPAPAPLAVADVAVAHADEAEEATQHRAPAAVGSSIGAPPAQAPAARAPAPPQPVPAAPAAPPPAPEVPPPVAPRPPAARPSAPDGPRAAGLRSKWPWLAAAGAVIVAVIAVVLVSSSGGKKRAAAPPPTTAAAAAAQPLPTLLPNFMAAVDRRPDGTMDLLNRGLDYALWYEHIDRGLKPVLAWKRVGGNLLGSPAATWDPTASELDVFWVGTDNRVYENVLTSTGWGPVRGPLGTARSPDGTITVSRRPDRSVDVMVRGMDNAPWHARVDATGNLVEPWAALKGTVLGAPASSWDAAHSQLDVFAIGTDQHVHTGALSAHGWTGLGAAIGDVRSQDGTINANRRSDGSVDVFARGTDNGAWHEHLDSAVHPIQPWEALGGPVFGAPIGTWDPSTSHLDMFAIDTQRGIDNDLLTSAGWQGLHGPIDAGRSG